MKYVVILAHEMDADGCLSENSIARVDWAVKVFGIGANTTYITSGGLLRPHWPEPLAEVVADRLVGRWNVGRKRIILLPSPKDTVGEAFFSRLELLDRLPGSVHVVTQEYHGKRAKIIFEYVYGNGNVCSYSLAQNIKNDSEYAVSEKKSINAFLETFRNVPSGDIQAIGKQLYGFHPLYQVSCNNPENHLKY